jgi:hypothetical protein
MKLKDLAAIVNGAMQSPNAGEKEVKHRRGTEHCPQFSKLS